MYATLDTPKIALPTLSLTDALQLARAYVTTVIDPSFAVVSASDSHPEVNSHGRWRFWIRCAAGPLHVIEVDPQTGVVQPFTEAAIRLLCEKAAVLAANKQGILPLDERGYVLGEYARRRANRYLGDHIGMYFAAVDPVLVAADPPYWQGTIVFKRYHLGPFVLGTMKIDAQTGEPCPLTKQQLQQIREHTYALIALHSQETAARF